MQAKVKEIYEKWIDIILPPDNYENVPLNLSEEQKHEMQAGFMGVIHSYGFKTKLVQKRSRREKQSS